MKRKILWMVLVLHAFLLTGCSLPTVSGQAAGKAVACSDVSQLEDEIAYVWDDTTAGSIEEDLEKSNGTDVFFPCVMGTYNFKREETSSFSQYPRTIWVSGEEDANIPTVTGNNALIYVSESSVPEEIVFERFADYGYTIGIANLIADQGDHYYITYADLNEDDYKYYVDPDSDAADIEVFDLISRLYLDKAGDIQVNKESVTSGGTVSGLEKGQSYICEFYTGTYYQDFLLTADVHTFGSMERFVSYDFTFLHSNCIRIDIPEYFKSGYYLINGVGIFRYIASGDEEAYHTGTIDYNDSIILTDDYGNVIYDPSVGTDDRYLYEIESQQVEEETEDSYQSEESDPGLEDEVFVPGTEVEDGILN